MGKTRAECSQNAYTSHASAFLSHWIQILANSSPKSDIKKKKKKKTWPCFFAFYGRSGEGNITIFFFGLMQWDEKELDTQFTPNVYFFGHSIMKSWLKLKPCSRVCSKNHQGHEPGRNCLCQMLGWCHFITELIIHLMSLSLLPIKPSNKGHSKVNFTKEGGIPSTSNLGSDFEEFWILVFHPELFSV